MTGAELKTLRESLGLSVAWLAVQAGVQERTVRYWESGRVAVPVDVAGLIARIEASTGEHVAQALAVVAETTADQGAAPESVDLRRYGTDDELWRAHPGLRPLPATWHAATLARVRRALAEQGVPARIEYAH